MFNKYPYTDFHELNLDWLLKVIKKAVSEIETDTKTIEELVEYVNNYFKNLDVSEEISAKIDQMVEDGTFEQLLIEFLDDKALVDFNAEDKTGQNILYADTSDMAIINEYLGNYQSVANAALAARQARHLDKVIRIASQNVSVYSALKPDPDTTLDPLYKMIGMSGADIIGFQEVLGDEHSWNPETYLATGYLPYVAWQPAFPVNMTARSQSSYNAFRLRYGNAIASDYPILTSEVGFYAAAANDVNRAYQKITIDLFGRTCGVYNTHLSTNITDRTGQISELADIVAADDSEIVIITGDFNIQTITELEPISNKGFYISNTNTPTSPNSEPTYIFDNVIFKGPVTIQGSGLIYTNFNYDMFDHNGWYIDLKIQEGI